MRLFNRRWLYSLVAPLDMPLLVIVGALSVLGLLTLYSAAPPGGSRFNAQIINFAVAFGIMLVVARIPPQKMMRWAVPIYLVGILLLLAVFAFGVSAKGARRWLNLGFMRIQPSEMLKIAVPLMLAWYFHRFEGALRSWHFVMACLLLAVPFLLIAKQPDLGTAILVGAAGFYVIFFAGLPWKVILGLSGLAAVLAPFAWTLLKDYQRRRILTLLDPTTDPLGAGYHIIQSTIAVGSGGLAGKGYLQGTQTHLEFLPERHTDFIFAVYSEEWGLLGNCFLLLLYLLLIGRGLMIAAGAPTLFSRLLAGSVTLIFFTYAFVNMGMVAGILPVVGVPLPFVSYGGTALVTLFLGIGILMSIQKHRQPGS